MNNLSPELQQLIYLAVAALVGWVLRHFNIGTGILPPPAPPTTPK